MILSRSAGWKVSTSTRINWHSPVSAAAFQTAESLSQSCSMCDRMERCALLTAARAAESLRLAKTRRIRGLLRISSGLCCSRLRQSSSQFNALARNLQASFEPRNNPASCIFNALQLMAHLRIRWRLGFSSMGCCSTYAQHKTFGPHSEKWSHTNHRLCQSKYPPSFSRKLYRSLSKC
jgi:hypothetical protein